MNVKSFNNITRKIRGDLAIKTFIHHDEVTMYKETWAYGQFFARGGR